jgi:hypothetical protein
VARAERGHGTRAHVGEPGGVDHGLRHASARVVQAEQAALRRQPEPVVVHVVADDLDPGQRERSDVAAQHVEVPPERLGGPQVHARLDHRLAQALRPEPSLHRIQDLVVRQFERLDVGPVEVGEVERRRALHAGSMHPENAKEAPLRRPSRFELEEDASPWARGCSRELDLARDGVERARDGAREEGEGGEDANGDDRKDNRILGHGLTAVALRESFDLGEDGAHFVPPRFRVPRD